MKKKTLAVLLSATLVTSSTTTVFAKDITVTIPNYASDEGNSNLPEAVETVTNSDGSISYTLDKKQQKKWPNAAAMAATAQKSDRLSGENWEMHHYSRRHLPRYTAGDVRWLPS